MENILNNLLLALLSAGLLIGLNALIAWGKKAGEKVENERAKKAIEKALEIVTLAVNETNQTFVKELKEAGKFDEAMAKEAFGKTKGKILDMMDGKTREILNQEFENTDTFLNSAIESRIWEDKKN